MPGFEFRYRLSGRPPTIESFALRDSETLSWGDMMSLDDGGVLPGATGDATFVGSALETLDGDGPTKSIRVIVDADAVYGIADARIRLKGATVDLSGPTGTQTLSSSVNGDFVVDVDSSADEETLVRINGGRHYDKSASKEPDERPHGGGEINAAIARAVARHRAAQLGRGPTKAQAFYRNNLVVVLLEDLTTTAERSLIAVGQSGAVLETRRAYEELLRPYLRSTVERLTGCKVRAFMSANHLGPDLAAELFVLDRPVSEEPARVRSPEAC